MFYPLWINQYVKHEPRKRNSQKTPVNKIYRHIDIQKDLVKRISNPKHCMKFQHYFIRGEGVISQSYLYFPWFSFWIKLHQIHLDNNSTVWCSFQSRSTNSLKTLKALLVSIMKNVLYIIKLNINLRSEMHKN